MLRYFLDRDAQENPENSAHYHHMLLEAIGDNNSAALDELLAASAFANQTTLRDPNGAASALLQAAIWSENTDIIRALLENGVTPNCTDFRGETPLHWAAQSGNIALIKLLLAYGADTTAKDDRYMLPKDVANYECRPEIQQMLAVPGR